ncbi:MAG: DUF1553 domain-containing protein [Verrucomicrobiales bacterium]|nr:DUF1553 domain-containing protein [Verrucomicrobiales bacterium]
MKRSVFSTVLVGVGMLTPLLLAAEPTPLQIEFFESKIRPILAQECYECHSEATKAKGGLLLDTRAGWQKGGDSGTGVIIPGDPENSLLLQSIRHEVEDLEMPKAGAKLEDIVLSDFEEWIEMGAPDPRDAPPSPEQLSEDTNWEAIRDRRKGWWSFQPIEMPAVPGNKEGSAAVDAFVTAALVENDLEFSPRAEPLVLLRRISFLLTGLPPVPEEMQSFSVAYEEDPDRALRDLVDRKLAEPSFGEKWARHWMDWIRYADSHGSEGDPAIPYAWRYRDYLIRAWNQDVPYDQLAIEHLAGDVLAEPRINEELQINESAIGPAHLRMVFHGFAPTDALDERVRFTDDQVNAVTKAFLGLTVSCARCHDHKFDAISQKDFYALFGIFTAPLPATVAVDAPGVLTRHRERLLDLKKEIRASIALDWQKQVESGALDWDQALEEPGANTFAELVAKLAASGNPSDTWQRTQDEVLASERAWKEWESAKETRYRWDFGDPEQAGEWTREGEGLLDSEPAAAGDFTLDSDGEGVVANIFPAGLYSNLVSSRHRGFLATPPIDLDGDYDLYVRMIGDGSSGRYAVQHYPRRGTVYPVTNLKSDDWEWTRYQRLDYWNGDRIHLEFATAGEAPILVADRPRSWFGVRDAWLVKKGAAFPIQKDYESLRPLFKEGESSATNAEEAKEKVRAALQDVLARWADAKASLTDEEALFLESALKSGLLSNQLNNFSPDVQNLVTKYRALEAKIPAPTRAPGMIEHTRHEQPLFDRGDHTKPLEIVPARFLEAIDESPYQTNQSGRLEMAEDLFREDNPFTARVIVNRVWYHLFGNGLVATMDNFGRLGEEPSHPELLDYLATRFRNEHQWSFKSLIRELVLTETFLQASEPTDEASSVDPENRLLSHFTTRRLEAEAIRDSILAVAGTLDETRYGPAVTGNAPRRSVYLRVKRNDLDPLLTTFDFPVPATTVGKRSSTNVPAQSLTLLNDRFIIDQAGRWADRVLAATSGNADRGERIEQFFELALGRPPSEAEQESAQRFLETVEKEKAGIEARKAQVAEELSLLREKKRSLIEPIHAALWEKKNEQQESGSETSTVAAPRIHWDFSDASPGAGNEIGHELFGSASVKEGALVLDGKGFLATDPLPIGVGEKSLFARVQLATDQQRGGGVISLQDLQGGLFDSIVYAESKPGEWLAGSNNHRRTSSFNAQSDPEALERPVALLLTYEKDGTIRCYRDGEPWGDPIRKAPLQDFGKGQSQILLGLRHGRATGSGDQGGRNLKGRIYEAGLYDRVLSPEEIRALSNGGAIFVSPEEIERHLTESQWEERDKLDPEISRVEKLLAEYSQKGGAFSSQSGGWHDLAHAIFNFKEFIYLR